VGSPGRECAFSDFVDQGDGTLTVVRPLPAGTWIVVTASNPLGEGPAGERSAGAVLERSLVPGWTECGSAP
jgi:hypothetical protein